MAALECNRASVFIACLIVMFSSSDVRAALPPDTDNAALLYYQAMILRPVPSDDLPIREVLRGATPDARLREYLDQPNCRRAIELVSVGSRCSKCDWGILYSRGWGLDRDVLAELPRLGRLLSLQTRTLAADGDCRAALDAFLTMRRFATHLGTDTRILYAMSQQLNMEALLDVGYVLGLLPAEPDTLDWLKRELLLTPGTAWSPAEMLQGFLDMEWRAWLAEPEAMAFGSLCSASLVASLKDLDSRDKIRARVRRSGDAFLASALKVIQSDRSYTEKVEELDKLTGEIELQIADGDPVALLWSPIKSSVRYYSLHVASSAAYNATLAAIEIYRVRALTGQLPETLPRDLPKDAFSGKDFEYRRTERGFVLRGRVKPAGSSRVREYDFAVRQ